MSEKQVKEQEEKIVDKSIAEDDIEMQSFESEEELEQVPGSLIRKIAGSKRKMREYFVEREKMFIPPSRDLTAKFCRQILSGEKDLLYLHQVKFLDDIPQDSEIKTKVIYDKIKNDKDVTMYLPDYPEKKTPSRVYLCNIVNTIYPDVIPKLVKKLKKEKIKVREQKLKKYVLVRSKFAATLKAFESKRKDDPEKLGRFIGMMQEDRKKVLKKRKRHSVDDFDFNLADLSQKKKPVYG